MSFIEKNKKKIYIITNNSLQRHNHKSQQKTETSYTKTSLFQEKRRRFFHNPVWERSGADLILKRKGEFFSWLGGRSGLFSSHEEVSQWQMKK